MFDNPSSLAPIAWRDDRLVLLDQRRLPQTVEELQCTSLEQATAAIRDLVVRGAPAIGITAAYAVCLGIQQQEKDSHYDLEHALDLLAAARPTAINLRWAVEQQRAVMHDAGSDRLQACLDNARLIQRQDVQDNLSMGGHGAGLITAGSRVLTHCNAGALATAGYGTALGVVRAAWADGKLERVYASETRPWQQGLRLTAWELAHDGIDVSVVVEGAIANLMQKQKIDWVIVGADRICANGDVINKVGTCNLAILARHFGVSMMVAAPSSTIDLATASGHEVAIEERDPREILGDCYPDSQQVSAWNPVFDVTPAALVSAIVSERGVISAPDKNKMKAFFNPD